MMETQTTSVLACSAPQREVSSELSLEESLERATGAIEQLNSNIRQDGSLQEADFMQDLQSKIEVRMRDNTVYGFNLECQNFAFQPCWWELVFVLL